MNKLESAINYGLPQSSVSVANKDNNFPAVANDLRS